MKTILLEILFGLFLVTLAHAEDLPACCGATTHRSDLPGRTNGWANNLPPLDAVRGLRRKMPAIERNLTGR